MHCIDVLEKTVRQNLDQSFTFFYMNFSVISAYIFIAGIYFLEVP